MLSERLAYETSEETSPPSRYMALTMGADPTTFSLTRRCSTVELRQLIDVLGGTNRIRTYDRVTLTLNRFADGCLTARPLSRMVGLPRVELGFYRLKAYCSATKPKALSSFDGAVILVKYLGIAPSRRYRSRFTVCPVSLTV
jgi:hypothetical protein